MSVICAGIDQSLKSSGVVILVDGVMVDYKVFGIEKIPKNPIHKAKAVQLLVEEIYDFLLSHGVMHICLEGLSFGSTGDAARDLAGLQMMMFAKFQEITENIRIIAPQTPKKFATGSGKAKKKDLFLSLPEKVGAVFGKVAVKNGRHDLTDAYFLGYASYVAILAEAVVVP